MPSYQVKVSSTAYPLVFLLVQSSDHITGLTGATPTVTISKAGGAFASPAGAVTEIGSGWYKVAGNATDTGTLGPLLLHATAASGDPCDMLYEVVAHDVQDAVHLGLSALPNAAASAAGGLLTFGTGSGQLNPTNSGRIGPDWNSVGTPGATVNLAATTISTGQTISGVSGNVTGSVGSVTGAVGSVTAAVTVGTNNDKTGYSLTQAFPSNFASLAIDASGNVSLVPSQTPVINTGTATAGAASTITLAAGASTTASLYNGLTIGLISGTGAGQARTITGYTAGRVATVDRAWTTTPDATTVYAVSNRVGPKVDTSLAVTAGTVSDKTGYSLTQAFPSNFAALAITAGGAVTVGTNGDKTGYSLTQAFPANFAALVIDASGNLTAGITGNITGNLSGSVGSVTGAVGSVTGNVGGNVGGSVASVTAAVDINLSQTGLSPRALDAVADASLTVGDALVCAISEATGKEAVVGTAYTKKTPSTGTVIRTFTLDSSTAPTSRT